MDAQLRAEILKTIKEAMTTYQEQWLTADQLLERFGMFTKEWLKRYGHSLPRTRAIVTDEQGIAHQTGWAYPANQIAHMIQTNDIKHLRCLSIRKSS